MVLEFVRQFADLKLESQLLFAITDIDAFFTDLGIPPVENTDYSIWIVRKNGARVKLGDFTRSDNAFMFAYSEQKFAASNNDPIVDGELI